MMKFVLLAALMGLAVALPAEYNKYDYPPYFYGPIAFYYDQKPPGYKQEMPVLIDFTPQIHAQGGSGPDGRIHGGYQVGGQVPIGGGSVGGSVSGTFGHGSDLPSGYQVGGSIPVGGGHVGIDVGGNFGHSPNSVGITGSWPFG